MKMNKIVGLSLAMMLGFSVVGCGKVEVTEVTEETEPQIKIETEENNEYEKKLNQTVINDDMFEIIFVKAYEDVLYGEVGYEVKVTNKTDKTISMYTHETSVDGVMCDLGHYENTTTPNKTRFAQFVWYIDDEDNKCVKSLDDLKNVETTLVILDENYNVLKEVTIKMN